MATLATRPAKSHASLQELTEGWRERADRHVPRALQAAWVTSLAGRNDLPLLTSDDLGEAILADAARAVLATGRGGRPGCRPARPGRTLGRRCHQQTPGWCRPHRRAHPRALGVGDEDLARALVGRDRAMERRARELAEQAVAEGRACTEPRAGTSRGRSEGRLATGGVHCGCLPRPLGARRLTLAPSGLKAP